MIKFIIITTFFAACTVGNDTSDVPIASLIIPKAGSNILLQTGMERELLPTQVITPEEFRVPIPDDYVPVRLLNENLDYDQEEEQIIAYKPREAGDENRIKLMVVRFDPVYSNVISTWEGTTLASESRSFSMFTEDVTGDFTKEIICAGIDDDGQQTLDIFHYSNDERPSSINFQSILSLSSSVGLELHRIERTEKYSNKIATGRSFPVYLYQNAEEPSMDIIRTQYDWGTAAKRYIPTDVQRVSASAHVREQLGNLFSQEAEEIARTLNGIWVKETDNEQLSMIFIDSDEKYLTLAHASTQEWFVWKRAYKTVLSFGPGIWIAIQNELLSSISSNKIWIAVLDTNTIHITVDGNNQYYGSYTRMKDLPTISGIMSNMIEISSLKKQLDGLFTGASNLEFFFSSPDFRFYDGVATHSGVYYIYHAFAPILELSTLNPSQRSLEKKQYQIVFTSQQQETTRVETLELYPVQVTLKGLAPLTQDAIRVDRILSVSDP